MAYDIIQYRGHMKKCIKCHCEKNEEEFYFYNKEKNARINTCKSCHGKIMTNWQKKNRDKCQKAWTKFNRKRNKGRICEYCGNNYKISTSQKGCSTLCRFHLGFDKKENGCWEWKKGKVGRKSCQYGGIWINRVHRKASHVAYELYKGKITPGLMVLHTCDNSICVNPAHLYLGTHQQNMNDMNSRGRGNKGRVRFDLYTKEQCKNVINLRKSGLTYRKIEELTGIKEGSCKNICRKPERITSGAN